MNITRLISGAAILLLIICPAVYGQTQITTAGELAAINDSKTSLAGDYLLMNDLTLDNWTPIGGHDDQEGQGFSGTFNGDGHTITVTDFDNSFNNTRIGLFGLIEKEGMVKNLCIAGEAGYTGSKKILYIGGIAGVNLGLISCCISKIALKGGVNVADGKPEKIKGLYGYEDGSYGGCIAGINRGSVVNCYSTGSVLIAGNRPINFAGGIVGGNGQPAGGSIGISVGSGGVGISANPGTVKTYHDITHCYSTATVRTEIPETGSKSTSYYIARSGGIEGINQASGIMLNIVALNDTIEASGTNGVSAKPSSSLLSNSFYCTDIILRAYKNGKEQKPKKIWDRNATDRSATQEESWWRYPEGVTEKQRMQKFGFLFGEDEQSPWVWSNEEKRPALYWERSKGE